MAAARGDDTAVGLHQDASKLISELSEIHEGAACRAERRVERAIDVDAQELKVAGPLRVICCATQDIAAVGQRGQRRGSGAENAGSAAERICRLAAASEARIERTVCIETCGDAVGEHPRRVVAVAASDDED